MSRAAPAVPASTATLHEHVRTALAGVLTAALAGTSCRVLVPSQASSSTGPDAVLASQAVCTLLDAAEHDEVQPDLAVACQHRSERPVLVVEVQTPDTLLRDTTSRLALYEAVRLPEYWIVDIAGRLVHAFWLNREGQYKLFQSAAPGEVLESKALPQLALPAWEGWLPSSEA